MSPRPPAGSGLLGFSGARGETGVHAWEGREKALKKLKGISKNSSHEISTESFPSYFTKFLRVGSTTRAESCFI